MDLACVKANGIKMLKLAIIVISINAVIVQDIWEGYRCQR